MKGSKKIVLITGIAGQDGTYLSELLVEKGYEVAGTVRDLKSAEAKLPHSIKGAVRLIQAGDNSQDWYNGLIREVMPHEVYNLAGLSYVPTTASDPAVAAEEIAMSAIRLLQAIRLHRIEARFYQASSSEMYGSKGPSPQSEGTPLTPVSPYGAAKAYTFFATQQYRNLFGMFACTGICYNHESPRRPPHFVSRRITQGVARVKLGLDRTLKLGSLEARRDWGFAKDYVHAMWLMLQHGNPGDYVIATGHVHTVRDFVSIAFDEVGLDWKKHIEVDDSLVRPLESRPLVGDPTKIKRELGWAATMKFEELVRMMVREDLARLGSA